MRKKIILKKAQEEIVGFALIVIVVAVILLIFLGFYLRKPKEDVIESYEVESFIQAFLQHTTDCEDNFERLPIQKLIFDCNRKEECLDGRKTCDVLNTELKEITKESWIIGKESPYKGYELKILSNEEEVILISEGNKTGNFKGGMQDLKKSGVSIEILFNVYS